MMQKWHCLGDFEVMKLKPIDPAREITIFTRSSSWYFEISFADGSLTKRYFRLNQVIPSLYLFLFGET